MDEMTRYIQSEIIQRQLGYFSFSSMVKKDHLTKCHFCKFCPVLLFLVLPGVLFEIQVHFSRILGKGKTLWCVLFCL